MQKWKNVIRLYLKPVSKILEWKISSEMQNTFYFIAGSTVSTFRVPKKAKISEYFFDDFSIFLASKISTQKSRFYEKTKISPFFLTCSKMCFIFFDIEKHFPWFQYLFYVVILHYVRFLLVLFSVQNIKMLTLTKKKRNKKKNLVFSKNTKNTIEIDF